MTSLGITSPPQENCKTSSSIGDASALHGNTRYAYNKDDQRGLRPSATQRERERERQRQRQRGGGERRLRHAAAIGSLSLSFPLARSLFLSLALSLSLLSASSASCSPAADHENAPRAPQAGCAVLKPQAKINHARNPPVD